MKTITKDILLADDNLIVHQVNNLGVMGAGLAKQVKEKYPEVFKAYKENSKIFTKEQLLGKLGICKISDTQYIVNMYSQDGISRYKQTTKYDIMEKCIARLVKFAKEMNYTIAIPYKIGCGLAGGDWETVKAIIEKYDDGRITIYRKE